MQRFDRARSPMLENSLYTPTIPSAQSFCSIFIFPNFDYYGSHSNQTRLYTTSHQDKLAMSQQQLKEPLPHCEQVIII